ncbi:MAG: hypothetical protein WC204_11750 [Elusimicrobiales bacterium]|jgi:hypothetical protein
MENEKTIILELRLTRGQALFLLTLLFLCWRPGFLGSETLTLTTFYPAPYGGYAGLLTTGQTILARDVDGTPPDRSYVRIGGGDAPPHKDGAKLEVWDGDINASRGIQWGNGIAALLPDDQPGGSGGAIQLGGTGGQPFIQFYKDKGELNPAKLVLSDSGQLQIENADLEITGYLKNVCSLVTFTAGGGPVSASCGANAQPVAYSFDGIASGYLARENPPVTYTQVYAGTGGGKLVCCKFK